MINGTDQEEKKKHKLSLELIMSAIGFDEYTADWIHVQIKKSNNYSQGRMVIFKIMTYVVNHESPHMKKAYRSRNIHINTSKL